MQSEAALECPCIVFRALLNPNWLDEDTGHIKPTAFMRRTADTDGLSVNIASETNVEELVRSFNKCHGLVTLHVGRVRNLGIDIVPDERPHALIVGLPPKDEDLDRAEYLAGELAKISRRVL